MARVTNTRTKAVGPWPTDGVVVTMTAADVTNKQQTPCTGREIIIAQNTGVSARTVTINSVAVNGRSGDITADSLAAGAIVIYGPFDRRGFKQVDGNIYFEASHAEVKFGVVELP